MSATSAASSSSATAQPATGAPATSDPLIAAWLAKLPPVGAAFPSHERAAWLNGFLASAHFVWHPAAPLQVGTATPPASTSVTPPSTDPTTDDSDTDSSGNGSSASASSSQTGSTSTGS